MFFYLLLWSELNELAEVSMSHSCNIWTQAHTQCFQFQHFQLGDPRPFPWRPLPKQALHIIKLWHTDFMEGNIIQKKHLTCRWTQVVMDIGRCIASPSEIKLLDMNTGQELSIQGLWEVGYFLRTPNNINIYTSFVYI